jgi:hypothetical protein
MGQVYKNALFCWPLVNFEQSFRRFQCVSVLLAERSEMIRRVQSHDPIKKK